LQVEKSEKFVKADDLKDQLSVIFKILEEPIEVTGQYGKKLQTRVLMVAGENKAKAKWSIGDMNRDRLIDKHGKETADWIGKEIPVHAEIINGKNSIVVSS